MSSTRNSNSLRVADFDYELPTELIAQHPLPNRDASRLMIVNPLMQTVRHQVFRDILDVLEPGDVLVFNNSKVLPARLYGYKLDTGARVELLLTKRLGAYEWQVMAKPAKRLKEGSVIVFPADDGQASVSPTTLSAESWAGAAEVESVEDGGLRKVRFILNQDEAREKSISLNRNHADITMEDFLHQIGHMPLPPYIHEPLREKDRYQTVYAKPVGSVAAPTAGLHFTEALLDKLKNKGVELQFVTLHVGIGTFRPVTVDKVEDHEMHSETYQVDDEVAAAINRAKAEGRRVIAVGTTALRTLESASERGGVRPGTGDTDIFIYPGYQFRVIDGLITNFHLPKSTLLMLVSALMGTEFARRVYEEAVRERYRFFSFGDAMFITGSADQDDRTNPL